MDHIQNIITRFLQKKTTNKDLKNLHVWVSKKPKLKELSDFYKIWIWTGINPSASPRINFYDTWQKIENNNKSRKIHLFTFLKYAAIIVLTLNIGWWGAYYFFNEDNIAVDTVKSYQVSASFEYNSVITLPDKTVVYLRPGTEFTYDSDFGTKNREVELEGEAYFNVTKNAKSPFLVNLEYGQVKVLGTQFNVCAEKGQDTYQTTLVEGKVEFITDNGEKYSLLPHHLLEYNYKDNKTLISKVETELYTAWKDGKVIFRDESLGEITQKLEKIYNVKFIYRTPELADKYSFAGTFYRETSIGEVMTMLKISIPMKVTREERFPEPDLIYLE